MVCACVTVPRSVGYVQIMRWWSSNIGKQPHQNLGYVAYCHIIILDPPLPLFPPSTVLLGEAATYCPDTPSTDVHCVSSQDHPTT